MMSFALSITGVAVDVLVQIQFGVLLGSTVLSNVRRQIDAPVAASSAASVFDCRKRIDDGFRSLRRANALRHERRRQHRVARLDLDRHLLVDLRFPFQAETSDVCFDSVDLAAVPAGPLDIAAPREPLAGFGQLCACTAQDMPPRQNTSTRPVARIISSCILREKQNLKRKSEVVLSYSPVPRVRARICLPPESVNTYATFLASRFRTSRQSSRNCLQNRGRTCMFCGS